MSLEITIWSEHDNYYGNFKYKFHKKYDQNRDIYKLKDVNFPCFNVPSNFYFVVDQQKSPIIRLPQHPKTIKHDSDHPQHPPSHMENNIWKQVKVGNTIYQIKFVLSSYFEFSDYDSKNMTYNIYKPIKIAKFCKRD